MERRGCSLPLLIGGATTSRQHTAVQDRARLRARDRARARREPGRRRRLGPARPRTPRRGSTARTGCCRSGCASEHATRQRRPLLSLAAARANREQVSFDELPPLPPFTGRRDRRARARRARPLHRLAVLLPRLGAEGHVPGDPRATRRRASCYEDALAELDADRRATARSPPRGVYGFWPAHAEGDDVVVGETRFCFLRQQAAHGDSRPNRCLADYVAARRRTRSAPSRSRSTAPTSSRRAPARPSTTTTARSSSRRSPTGSPRRSPSGCTSGRAASGTPPDEQLPREELLRRALPRHPARVRLPGLPRPQREGQALRPARRARARDRADRELRDDARPRR